MSSGSSRAESGVEPTRSQTTTVSWRRSPAKPRVAEASAGGAVIAGESAPPHLRQNRRLARPVAPQEEQRSSTAAPQPLQKLLSSGVSQWQLAHPTSSLAGSSPCLFFKKSARNYNLEGLDRNEPAPEAPRTARCRSTKICPFLNICAVIVEHRPDWSISPRIWRRI